MELKSVVLNPITLDHSAMHTLTWYLMETTMTSILDTINILPLNTMGTALASEVLNPITQEHRVMHTHIWYLMETTLTST